MQTWHVRLVSLLWVALSGACLGVTDDSPEALSEGVFFVRRGVDGYTVAPPNGARARCADGATSFSCDVRAIDVTASGIGPRARAMLDAAITSSRDAPTVLVHARIERDGTLHVRDVWCARARAAVTGAVYRVVRRERSLVATRVNTVLEPFELTDVHTHAVPAFDAGARAAMLDATADTEGTLVAASYLFEGDDVAPSLEASQVFVRVR